MENDIKIDVSGSITTPEDDTKKQLNLLPVPGHIREWISERRQNIRPWSTFFNTNIFRAPSTLQFLSKRVVRNLEYFMSNYLIIFSILTIYCLLTSPLLILAAFVGLGACYILSLRNAEKPIVLFGRQLTMQQQYTIIGACSLPIFYWAGAGAAVFWILGASFFFITLHAAFFNISALQLSDDDHFDLILENV